MRRRTLLRGAALAVPATVLAGAGTAAADVSTTANFRVVVTEQVSNRIMVFDKDSAFTDANVYKTFSPGGGGWSNLSDVRIRDTASFGVVGLAAASGGNVGIWNVTDEKHQESNDLLWSAAPGGNPHAAERIPDIGAIVTASSHGYLTVYGPTAVSRPETLAKVQTVSLPGAHGVLWDPTINRLWAIGDKTLRTYEVTGTYRNTRLRYTGQSITLPGLGHDLQPDYSDPGRLWITDTYGIYRVVKSTMQAPKYSSSRRVKSFVRHSSGEDFWVQADDTGSRTWGSPTVVFSQSDDRTRSGAEFYKARWYATSFH
ncbi:hypothetical protein LX16_5288 [Stackebrandtia albiflava]|uniref:Uncharacterized protein n=1 Tax=Stackebrandtia albiflava TaxID=406432 RepID=A0A562UL37_9ACTN|nr:DUF6528 family protein [Stackebrandtia albiflava]TWJ06324.1 hypothetical protein LX16_5288 [Stackebrandtia albiflava]